MALSTRMKFATTQEIRNLRHTVEGEALLRELYAEEANRLEALLVALSSRNPSWELGAAATLAPWNWSAATTEQLLLEEHIRCQMARTNATPSVASSDSGGTVSSSASRPSGADEGVLDVQISGDRRLLVRVTLFASGFVIGPKGKSIRKIEILTHCRISSSVLETEAGRKIRLFCIDGDASTRDTAFQILTSAVARYRTLCDCTVVGKKVDHVQYIEGVKFYYYPPPKTQNREVKEVSSKH